MKDKLTPTQAQDILKSLDEAIEKGPWDASNFLKMIGKKLREIRQDFSEHLDNPHAETIKKTAALLRDQQRIGQQEVYIALYSTEGNDIHAWEHILANLPRQVVSRPIYKNEDDVINVIKTKANKINEAYVAIYINQTDILVVPDDKLLMDKLGKPLLTIKDRALNLNNISRFVHFSGVYDYRDGYLIRHSQ